MSRTRDITTKITTPPSCCGVCLLLYQETINNDSTMTTLTLTTNNAHAISDKVIHLTVQQEDLTETPQKLFENQQSLETLVMAKPSPSFIKVLFIYVVTSSGQLHFQMSRNCLQEREYEAVQGCKSLRSIVIIPDSVTIIREYAFGECTNLERNQFIV